MIAPVFVTVYSMIWIAQANEFSQHHDYTAMVDLMRGVNERCPDITRLYTLPMDDRFKVPGQSWQNRKLWVIEFAKNPGMHVKRELFQRPSYYHE